MNSPAPQRVPTLSPQESVDLWKRGKEVWNAWVKSNPIYNINFSGVLFSQHLVFNNEKSHIQFDGFIFPCGEIDFRKAVFDTGHVSFLNTVFSGGIIHFEHAEFSCTRVSFVETKFNAFVIFNSTNFNDTAVDFRNSKFNCAAVQFIRAKFGQGFVHFGQTTFSGANVDFREAIFGTGNLYFDGTTFSSSSVNFSGAKFCGGEVSFDRTDFGTEPVNFSLIDCKSCFTISNVTNVKAMSFRGATFHNMIFFKDFSMLSVLDLVGTKLSHQLSLHGFSCLLPRVRTWRQCWLLTAKDKEDVARLNRLKELAESNKHHAMALKFHADEYRSKRWTSTGILASILDVIFSGVCNYGQSIKRPVVLWLMQVIIFAWIYSEISKIDDFSAVKIFELSFLSVANSFPFLNSYKEIREIALDKYFINDSLISIYPLIFSQGFLSVFLIFLIGLGLRNRFRI